MKARATSHSVGSIATWCDAGSSNGRRHSLSSDQFRRRVSLATAVGSHGFRQISIRSARMPQLHNPALFSGAQSLWHQMVWADEESAVPTRAIHRELHQ